MIRLLAHEAQSIADLVIEYESDLFERDVTSTEDDDGTVHEREKLTERLGNIVRIAEFTERVGAIYVQAERRYHLEHAQSLLKREARAELDAPRIRNERIARKRPSISR
jgi:hypothetical protein